VRRNLIQTIAIIYNHIIKINTLHLAGTFNMIFHSFSRIQFRQQYSIAKPTLLARRGPKLKATNMRASSLSKRSLSTSHSAKESILSDHFKRTCTVTFNSNQVQAPFLTLLYPPYDQATRSFNFQL
ncbi:hypothetical protein PanWU01x14_217220, partial [Parasponia andersonii]